MAPTSDDLYGTWRLRSFVQRSVSTGEKTDAFGRHPRGFLSYSRDGRMYAMLVRDGRHRPSETEELSYQKRADLYDTMYAYAGTFSFDGGDGHASRGHLLERELDGQRSAAASSDRRRHALHQHRSIARWP